MIGYKTTDLLQAEKIFFKNLDEIQIYQEKMLNLLKVKSLKHKETIEIQSSGTSHVLPKVYNYDKKMYQIIEDYHWNRIIYFNKIPKGPIIRFKPVNYVDNESIKPKREWATGIKNTVYYIPYNGDTFYEDYWKKIFIKIKKLKPSIFYCTPSLFTCLEPFIKERFNCSIIFSQETLYDYTRNKAKLWFNQVIDKMRCWDGGLSFFECRYGTKHINDELCVAKSVNNQIISTDLFNYAQEFINYKNDDIGEIEIKQCACGIFGNVFKKFEGKNIQCIKSENNELIPGTLFANELSYISSKSNGFKFKILQKEDKNIEVYVDRKIKQSTADKIAKTIFVYSGKKPYIILRPTVFNADQFKAQIIGGKLKILPIQTRA